MLREERKQINFQDLHDRYKEVAYTMLRDKVLITYRTFPMQSELVGVILNDELLTAISTRLQTLILNDMESEVVVLVNPSEVLEYYEKLSTR